MRNKSFVVLFSIIIVISSCDEDLQLIGQYGSKPIIYCLLNPDDSIHYMRISESFIISDNPNDYNIPSDSLILHDDFYAYVEEEKPGRIGDITYFELPIHTARDSGYFPQEGMVTLAIKLKLNPGETYSLYVNLPDYPKILSGSTTIIRSVEILDPSPLPGRETTILQRQGYHLRWTSTAKFAVYQPLIRLNYLEGDSVFLATKSLELPRPLVFVNDESQIVASYINGPSFYKQILKSLVPPPEDYRRKVISFDVELFAGGEELALMTQLDAKLYQSFYGLNDFSNIDGAIGVFSSITSTASYNNRFSDFTIDYLASSDSTSSLGFLKHDQDF